MNIKIKKLAEDANLPSRGSEQAAGYDLYAYVEDTLKVKDSRSLTIPPHETVLVRTGIAVAIPEGYFGGIYARSGLSIKQGLRPGNCTGVIDSDYRGEIMVGLHNDSEDHRTISNGDRIAQLIVQKYESVSFEEVDELDDTVRGEGGFGSTGSK